MDTVDTTSSTTTTTTTEINPLNLPEIRLLISLYLDYASILACCQVNRAFLNDFGPFLSWKSVALERRTREDFPLVLIQQHEHLILRLVLEDTQVFINGWKFLNCRNLKVLHLCVDSRRFDDDHGRHPAIREVGAQMQELVRQNLELEELRINWKPMSLQHRQILNRDLKDLCSNSIRRLQLYEATCDVDVINALIDHCPRLEELTIEGYYFTPDGLYLVLELKHIRKLILDRVACRHGVVAFMGAEVRELRLRYVLLHEQAGPLWVFPKLELLCCEDSEGAVPTSVLGQWSVNLDLSKVKLRNTTNLKETLGCLVGRRGEGIRELTIERNSMWTLSLADRRMFLQQTPNLEKLNGYPPRSWASTFQSCTIS
ncbi:hypothetical protein BGZ96_011014 [Linnemannia gamsii]|uniref:F-box domain-containing protein n=1 Tax=Linnemannia gamsii TaxID=64522 RepID=A0ABQ7KCJ4_9FUNG|nr:hypothetical protein BGZ96_011014 [Linnemannia gamsii]